MAALANTLYETFFIKGRDGWEAATYVSLGGNLSLGIKTHKAWTKEKGVCTVLAVSRLERGFRVSNPPVSPFLTEAERAACDFYMTGETHPGTCTEKAIRKAHEAALAQVDASVQLAKAHYANRSTAPAGWATIEAGIEA